MKSPSRFFVRYETRGHILHEKNEVFCQADLHFIYFFYFLNVFQAGALTRATKLNDIARGITIVFQHLHDCCLERAASNITLSCSLKETSGDIRNWVWSWRKVGVVWI